MENVRVGDRNLDHDAGTSELLGSFRRRKQPWGPLWWSSWWDAATTGRRSPMRSRAGRAGQHTLRIDSSKFNLLYHIRIEELADAPDSPSRVHRINLGQTSGVLHRAGLAMGEHLSRGPGLVRGVPRRRQDLELPGEQRRQLGRPRQPPEDHRAGRTRRHAHTLDDGTRRIPELQAEPRRHLLRRRAKLVEFGNRHVHRRGIPGRHTRRQLVEGAAGAGRGPSRGTSRAGTTRTPTG